MDHTRKPTEITEPGFSPRIKVKAKDLRVGDIWHGSKIVSITPLERYAIVVEHHNTPPYEVSANKQFEIERPAEMVQAKWSVGSTLDIEGARFVVKGMHPDGMYCVLYGHKNGEKHWEECKITTEFALYEEPST